jgi:hypothetical protein
MTATGVARPRAQGHATTSVATAGIIASTNACPVSSQPANVARLSSRMAGTNTEEMR